MTVKSHPVTIETAERNNSLYFNSFFFSSSRLWNCLPSTCFHVIYDLQSYLNVNHFLFSWIMFILTVLPFFFFILIHIKYKTEEPLKLEAYYMMLYEIKRRQYVRYLRLYRKIYVKTTLEVAKIIVIGRIILKDFLSRKLSLCTFFLKFSYNHFSDFLFINRNRFL